MTEVQNVGVSRRRIIQGAAWATPAIMIAAAAPAAASSVPTPAAPTLHITRGGTGTTRNVTNIYRVNNSSTAAITTITVTFTIAKQYNRFWFLSWYSNFTTSHIASATPTGWVRSSLPSSATDNQASTTTVTYIWNTPLTGSGTAANLALTLQSANGNTPSHSTTQSAVSATSPGGAVTITTV